MVMHSHFTRLYLLAVLLGASHFSFGQTTSPRSLYLTAARSDAWMDSVRRLPLPAQLAAIRARVLADTVLHHRPQFVCLMPLTAAQREAYGRAQAPRVRAEATRQAGLLLLYHGDGYGLSTNDQAQTLAFVRELNSRTIQRVEFIKSSAPATVLYGTSGANGVVVLIARKP